MGLADPQNIDPSQLSRDFLSLKWEKEKLKSKGKFSIYFFEDHGLTVGILSTLDIVCSGATKEEMIHDMEIHLKALMDDFRANGVDWTNNFLRERGWTQEKFFKKRFKAPYVDKAGALLNFDIPDDVEVQVQQVTTAA